MKILGQGDNQVRFLEKILGHAYVLEDTVVFTVLADDIFC